MFAQRRRRLTTAKRTRAGRAPRRPQARLTCLSTFTGLGGLDLGLEAAGFDIIGCVEWDPAAQRSLKANRGGAWPLLEPSDIEVVARNLEPRSVGLARGDLDLLAGAPPCQPYSKAAQWTRGRAGLADRRAQYLDDHLSLLEAFLPKVCLIENVRGFVHGDTSVLRHLDGRLDKIARATGARYRVEHRVLDASLHGVPQQRVRAIVILSRLESALSWPADSPPTTAWDAIGETRLGSDAPAAVGKWADLLPSIPEGWNYLWHTNRGGGMPLFGWRTRYWAFLLKLSKDRPSWTIPANPGPATGPFHWDNRPLDIPELLRLQTFPVDWIVEGRSRAERVRQIGNATPPLLAEKLGRCLSSHITGVPVSEEPPTLRVARGAAAPPPAPIAQVPSKYQALIGSHPDHPGHGRGPGAWRS